MEILTPEENNVGVENLIDSSVVKSEDMVIDSPVVKIENVEENSEAVKNEDNEMPDSGVSKNQANSGESKPEKDGYESDVVEPDDGVPGNSGRNNDPPRRPICQYDDKCYRYAVPK